MLGTVYGHCIALLHRATGPQTNKPRSITGVVRFQSQSQNFADSLISSRIDQTWFSSPLAIAGVSFKGHVASGEVVVRESQGQSRFVVCPLLAECVREPRESSRCQSHHSISFIKKMRHRFVQAARPRYRRGGPILPCRLRSHRTVPARPLSPSRDTGPAACA